MNDADVKVKGEIIRIIQERKVYNSALVQSAMERERDEWKNVLTKIILTREIACEPISWDYKDFKLSKFSITTDEFIKVIEKLMESKNLSLKNLPTVNIDGGFDMYYPEKYLPSNESLFRLGWPGNFFLYTPPKRDYTRIQPLLAVDAPLFPDSTTAVRVQMGIDNVENLTYYRSVMIFLPNYTTKIEELRLSSEGFNIKIVQPEAIRNKNIIGKLFCEQVGKNNAKQIDIEFDQDSKQVPIGYIPNRFELYILMDDGQLLDYRKFHPYLQIAQAGVIFDFPEEQVQGLVRLGENERVEFKKELRVDKNKDEFTETVVAFANASGGTILIGVEDDGNIVGVDDNEIAKIPEKVNNILASKCEPPIQHKIQKIQMQKKIVFLIQIEEGKDKRRCRKIQENSNQSRRIIR